MLHVLPVAAASASSVSLAANDPLFRERATGGGGGCGTVAHFELPILVNRFDPFGGMIEVVETGRTVKSK